MFSKLKSFLFKNTTSKQTVAKNTVWLTISNFGGRLIKAAVVIYAARALGTAGYGVFSYAVTLAAFFTIFMDPGLNGMLMRDTSNANIAERQKIFSTMSVIKIVLLALGVGIILLIAPMFSTLPGAKAILPIVALILGFDTIREFFTSVLRSEEHMEWDAAIFLLTNLGILIFGFTFLAVQTSPASFAWAYVVGDIFGVVLAIWLIRKKFINLFAHIDWTRIKPILNNAWPFAVVGALGALLTSTDILIVSWMKTASDVGIYSAVIRIVQVLYLVPTVIQFSILPLFGRLARNDNAKFRTALEQVVGVIFMAAIPLVVGGVILGTPIMALVFGSAYVSGSLAFKILMVTMLVDYPAMVISNAIFAYNHQRSLIISSAIGGVANVALDLLLIPRFGIVGSAIGTLIAQTMSNAYLWHAMKSINYFEVMPKLGNAIVAGIGMGLVVFALFILHVNLIINISIGAVVYLGILYLRREPLLKEARDIVMPRQSA